MNPATEPVARQFAWYVGENSEYSGTLEGIFPIDVAKAAGAQLLAEGKLTEPVDLYVRPDQAGARWRRFTASPAVEVLARA